jgi:glutamyl-tRNA synthetase
LDELSKTFDIKGVNKAPAVFDINKLNWMNGEYIRKLPPEKFHEYATPYYKGNIAAENVDLRKVSKLLQVRTEVLNTIPSVIDFFEKLPEYDTALYVHKKMKTTEVNSLESLKAAVPVLEAMNSWDEQTIHDELLNLALRLGIKNGQMLWPVRTAVSGKAVSPGGAIEIADILGKAETIRRIRIGIDKLTAVTANL